MRYFGSNPMFFCFDDCLIKFSHCFKLFIICLFHVRLSQLNADMKMFKPFCRLSIRSTHCSKGNEDCFVSMPIVSLVQTVSHFNAHCSKAFEKRCTSPPLPTTITNFGLIVSVRVFSFIYILSPKFMYVWIADNFLSVLNRGNKASSKN